MPFVIAVLPHDFLGKFELLAQRETEEEAFALATTSHPFTAVQGKSADSDDDGPNPYSAIIWLGTLEDAYEGKLDKPIAIFYRGQPWSRD
jgi:hypothetical protein